MDIPSQSTSRRVVRTLGVWAGAAILAVMMTWPLAGGMGHLGRTRNSGDARHAVWNVAWVAHALITDPADVYDANIFYPHRNALAFSEANLLAGLIAVPAWALTKNPFAAFNFVVLLSFAASVVAMFYLVRYLTRDTAGAWVAAIIYAFCPYLFSHTPHVQLLIPGGIPLSLLMLHRLVDAPSPRRGVALGLALALQALSCAYYGIFAGLSVGFGTLFYASSRRYWTSARYWLAIAAAATISVGIVAPFFLPYMDIQQETGFARSLDDARMYAANWRSYLASSAHVHEWILPMLQALGGWGGEVLFPGFVALVLGAGGAIAVARQHEAKPATGRLPRDRETALLYGAIAVLAFWASLGPDAGLYTLFYKTIPVFSFLRAPGRIGIIVVLSLGVLAAFGVRASRRKSGGRRSAAIGLAAVAAAVIDLAQMPFDWRVAEPIPALYRVLAAVPRGPVVEFPFYDRRADYHIHTRYMLNSTAHWQPLVNGYSDHTPLDFRKLAVRLASFPSRDAFDAMRERRARYIVIHQDRYDRASAADLARRLEGFKGYLKLLADDGHVQVYEVTGFPP